MAEGGEGGGMKVRGILLWPLKRIKEHFQIKAAEIEKDAQYSFDFCPPGTLGYEGAVLAVALAKMYRAISEAILPTVKKAKE